MKLELQKQTVNETLWNCLETIMSLRSFDNFRLVGGTSLSLVLGHRKSIDIDLFSDSNYGSIDFIKLLSILKSEFKYVDHFEWSNQTPGNSCFVGNNENECVKLDLYYTDTFVYPIQLIDQIRLSSLEEIVAMNVDVIGRGGRKKDFWDIHELFDHFDLESMLTIYTKRYQYNFSKQELLNSLVNFEYAEHDPEPICLKGKYWELIKLDFEERIEDFL
ncbi:Nucleotidyl transferase AbiEii toxin, Type IV TA system [Spirosomataceae bacterium TFI 002]|nr:Nucleotidyl transferase AbiEii toxin, Type IV TA system [Spirosomataceae bacterium TFI 002]